MLTAVLLALAAGTVLTAVRLRSRRKRKRARLQAEVDSWPSLADYVAEHEHPPAPTRWAAKRDRGP